MKKLISEFATLGISINSQDSEAKGSTETAQNETGGSVYLMPGGELTYEPADPNHIGVYGGCSGKIGL